MKFASGVFLLNKSGKLQIKYKILKFTRLNITSKENLKFGLSEIK
ncbi:hypothetical protein [uncultured Campylobacter sp.]|nr:hypothetical protein [uncultured Campylobacter sp.]